MKAFKKMRLIPLLTALLLAVMMTIPAKAAEPNVNLGTASGFAVLAGTEIISTATATQINGDVGVAPGTTVTWLTAKSVTGGAIHINDDAAISARKDLALANADVTGRTSTKSIAADLGGQTLTPGVYSLKSPAILTGTLKLDAQGDPNAVFIFKTASTLTTEADSTIELINGARFSRIFWQVGSTAVLGANTIFKGSILADTSITAGQGATVQGRLLAVTGSVTLIGSHLDAIESDPSIGTMESVIPQDSSSPVTTEPVPPVVAPGTTITKMTAKSDPILQTEGGGDTYKATIDWGAMTFNYNLGTWIPDAHSWVGGGWDTADFNGVNDKVTVTNESTQPITATFLYTKDKTNGGATDGTFTILSGNLNGTPTGTMTLGIGLFGSTYLNLRGAPAHIGSTPTKIGSITVTLNTGP